MKNAVRELVTQKSFVIVRNNKPIELIQRGDKQAKETFLGFRRKRIAALAVDANDLLVARDDARFHGGDPMGIGKDAANGNARFSQASVQRRTGFVRSKSFRFARAAWRWRICFAADRAKRHDARAKR